NRPREAPDAAADLHDDVAARGNVADGVAQIAPDAMAGLPELREIALVVWTVARDVPVGVFGGLGIPEGAAVVEAHGPVRCNAGTTGASRRIGAVPGRLALRAERNYSASDDRCLAEHTLQCRRSLPDRRGHRRMHDAAARDVDPLRQRGVGSRRA